VTDARIGELAGLATAALWVVSSLSFTAAGRRLGATRVNLLRTLGAAVVLAFVQWMWFGQWLPRTEVAAMLWLACSGLLGLTIGDQFLFTGYVMLGPRTVSLLMTLSPSLAATIAWVCFGEGMTGISVLGMLITTGGQMVRIPVQGIREAGRNTMGVKLVNLDAGDKLQAIAQVIGEDAGEAPVEGDPAV
jgi:drug/metabolite transporter (DMT)-like permease